MSSSVAEMASRLPRSSGNSAPSCRMLMFGSPANTMGIRTARALSLRAGAWVRCGWHMDSRSSSFHPFQMPTPRPANTATVTRATTVRMARRSRSACCLALSTRARASSAAASRSAPVAWCRQPFPISCGSLHGVPFFVGRPQRAAVRRLRERSYLVGMPGIVNHPATPAPRNRPFVQATWSPFARPMARVT